MVPLQATYLERYDDLNVELFREPFVALRQPVVEPTADQKLRTGGSRELALKLGLGAYYLVEDDRGVPRPPAGRPADEPRAAAPGVARRATSCLLRGGREARVRGRPRTAIEFWSA
ncbi:MAG: hypothetical protein U0599_15255 [Vicinamibacteria bacterium]